MTKSMRFALHSATAIITIQAVPVSAQSSGELTAPAADASPASASDESAAGIIVVTAQRREERVQDVPMALSAFGADQIARAGVASIDSIAPLLDVRALSAR